MHDLVASAVVEADVRLKPVDACADLIRPADQRACLLIQNAQIAQKAQTVPIPLHRVDALVQILLEKAHNAVHLVLRTLPVFRGKGVDRQIVDPELLAIGADAAEHLRARPVPCRARKTPLLRPATVAVHDNRNMRRQVGFVNLPHAFLRSEQSHQTAISSFSFLSRRASISLHISSVSFWRSFSASL